MAQRRHENSQASFPRVDHAARPGYDSAVTTITPVAIPITAVASQPMKRSDRSTVNFPIILGLAAIFIMVISIGTATTPLTTALQTSAFTGLKPARLIDPLPTVISAIVAWNPLASLGRSVRLAGKRHASARA